VIAVGLALVSAIFFGAMSVTLRLAMNRTPDVQLATLLTVVGALAVALVAVAAEVPSRGVHAGDAWPFVLAGLLSPGAAQLLVTLAVREAGASRTSMVFGAAPLVSVTIALVFLDEPPRVPLLVAAVLIVAGGIELARERDRPEHLRAIGLVYAFLGVVLFATRDNILRWLATDTTVPPAVAAAAALLGGAVLVAAVAGPSLRLPSARAALPFLGVGLLFGSSYVTLFEAYYRGRVTVVSPLVATESLWGVVLAVLLLRDTELVGRRLLAGTILIVAGGALIGVYR
jgi:drug/metabolite transporter (DMT)-like permease